MAKRETAAEMRERMRNIAAHPHSVSVVTDQDQEATAAPAVEPAQEGSQPVAPIEEPTPQRQNATTLQRRGKQKSRWTDDYGGLDVYPYTVHLPLEDLEWIKAERNRRHFRREWMVIKLALDRLRAESGGESQDTK